MSLATAVAEWGSLAGIGTFAIVLLGFLIRGIRRAFRLGAAQLQATKENTGAIHTLTGRVDKLERTVHSGLPGT